MKKILFYLPIAVFAFAVSLGGVYVYDFFTKMPEIVEVSDELNAITTDCDFGLNRIDAEYKYTVRGKDYSNGVFTITNLTYEPVYYMGYEKSHHADNWITQNGKTTTSLICHMEMSEYELKPSESVTVEIPLPKNGRSFEAGFAFYNGAGDKLETSRTEIDKQKVFVEKSAR